MYKLIFRTILLIVFLVPVQAWDDITLTASDGAEVIIDRDEFGVPHISGPTEFSVFYAMGFAAAQDRLKQMTINLHSSTGRTMEINQGNLYWDREIRKEYYSLTERQAQFESLQPAVQNMLIAYAEGVNTYYQYMEEEPMLYTPEFIYILQQAGWVIQPWTVYDCIAIHQFYSRNFGQNGGLELLRLSELNNHGWDWFELNRPINNPAAPTTIPDDEAGEALQQGEWHHNDVIFDPNIVTQMQNQDIIMNQIADELNLPEHFGSFAALIDPNKSATSNAMLLGCPQMGAPNLYETNVVNEVELICPDMHVAGMAVAGWPLVIIGHTEDFAWTLTSGFSDNTDTYVDSTQDQTMSNYLYNGEWIPAGGLLAFELDGWVVQTGDDIYIGELERFGSTITASSIADMDSLIEVELP